jgi:hypothetical protein
VRASASNLGSRAGIQAAGFLIGCWRAREGAAIVALLESNMGLPGAGWDQPAENAEELPLLSLRSITCSAAEPSVDFM